MKTKTLIILFAAACSLLAAPRLAVAQGTAFTYQGRLNSNSNSVTGAYDFQFQVFDAATAGSSYGSPNPNSVVSVPVSNGLFTVTLDFGTGVFTGPARWLQISVRTNGVGTYNALTPRQALTPTPYAIYAANAGTLGGQGSTAYVAKAGDTMTGTLNLPANGLAVGGSQLVASGGKVGIGTVNPAGKLHVYGNSAAGTHIPSVTSMLASGDGFNNRIMSVYGDQSIYLSMWHAGYGEVSTYDWAANAGLPLVLNSNGGNVGIGTTSPQSKLEVQSTNSSGTAAINGMYSPTGTYGELGYAQTSGDFPSYYGVYGNAGNGGYAARFDGYVYVNGSLSAGGTAISSSGTFGSPQLQISQNTPGDYARIRMSVNSSASWDIAASDGATPTLSFYSAGQNRMTISQNGNVSVGSLTITGGSDVAEPFHISTQHIAKGSIVIIDEENSGQLKVSNQAYDKRVAGIISGANGINPGLSLHQTGALEGGEDVALSGRVYALADASNGAIKPGDLLTTSSTPGHCMKVTDHLKAQGAVIGKAMSSLANGKGMVLVLVSLQ